MADPTTKPSASLKLTLEAWSQGFMIGALIIMLGITLSNMRRGVFLHKLILIELLLAVPNGFFIFFDPPVWGWFLSSTVVPLITSWSLHNVIAWLKNKPFLDRRGSWIYIGTVIMVQPYWILEIYANFAYFNGSNNRLFAATRPYEAVFRDPWWIFTIVNLFWNIRFRYELGFLEIVRLSPRFGILLLCMFMSVIFIVVDILSVTPVIPLGVINPFWKFAFVFKCFTDSIILDDFKTSLDKLSRHRMAQVLPFNVFGGTRSRPGSDIVRSDRVCPDKLRRSLDGLSIAEIEVAEGYSWVELPGNGEFSAPLPPSQAAVNPVSKETCRNSDLSRSVR